jgi:hypothetical protein
MRKVAQTAGFGRSGGKNYRERAFVAGLKGVWHHETMKKWFVLLLACAGIAMGTGCASNGWQAEQVPLPTPTPFDANQMARNAYLEGFREGFRAQQNKSNSIELVGGPNREAKLAGFRAGAAEARARQSGDVAPVSPISTSN